MKARLTLTYLTFSIN